MPTGVRVQLEVSILQQKDTHVSCHHRFFVLSPFFLDQIHLLLILLESLLDGILM